MQHTLRMVDIHCHILPALDDGPDTLESSLAMAEDAIADGLTHVIATPHASSDFFFDYAKVRAAVNELRAHFAGRIHLATGCDFHLNHENLLALRNNPQPYCLNQKDYLLVEFNEFSIPLAMDQTLHELRLAGLHPIVTHPERNAILRTHSQRLLKWIELGCYVQITAGSLTGVFGSTAQQFSWNWLGKGMVHFVASDAHNTGRRPLKLRFAHDEIAARLGEERARFLLIDNPLAAFEGQPLPYVPEVTTLVEPRKRRRFFFF
jgi:protein-tyrosine phosphatase